MSFNNRCISKEDCENAHGTLGDNICECIGEYTNGDSENSDCVCDST